MPLPAPLWPYVGACAIGLAMTLLADARGQRALEWVGKPLAALAFVAAGFAWGGLDSPYAQWILAGLVFGALGDVLLIPPGTGKVFLGGMVAFALGHLFYVVAFAQWPMTATALAGATLGMLLFALLIGRWLMPHVPRDFVGPVLGYIGIISLMVAVGIAITLAGAPWPLLVGAIGFARSDLAVARHRFVAPGRGNRLWGLPLYFASQLVIASTVIYAP